MTFARGPDNVAMLAVGLFSAVANGCILAILQATIAPEYQGRVFTEPGGSDDPPPGCFWPLP